MTGYRTILFATSVLLLGILQSSEFHTYLADIHMDGNGTVTSAIGIVIGILRLLTTTAPFTKGDK